MTKRSFLLRALLILSALLCVVNIGVWIYGTTLKWYRYETMLGKDVRLIADVAGGSYIVGLYRQADWKSDPPTHWLMHIDDDGGIEALGARHDAKKYGVYLLGFGAWSSTDPYQPHFAVKIAQFPLAVILGAIPAGWLLLQVKRRRKHQAGCCPDCGYDLRASTNTCPECGLEINDS